MKIRSTSISLLNYKLSSAAGGSGVTEVDVIVCDIVAQDGLDGLGFSYAIGGRGAPAAQAARVLADEIVTGAELEHPEATWWRLCAACNRTGRGPNFVGLAAIDLALWDLHAKRLDLPLGSAMGGSSRSVAGYGSGGFRPNQDAKEIVDHIARHREAGFCTVKLRLSGQPQDVKMLESVRSSVPDGTRFMIDLNEKGSLTSARSLMRTASILGALFVEEPLPAHNVEGYRILARAFPGLTATGEHLQGTDLALPFLKEGLCSVNQPDLAMMGGMTECLRLTRAAELFGVEVMPHFLPGLFVHLAAVSASVTLLEDFPLLEPIFSGVPEFEGGVMSPASVAGHGLSLKRDFRSKLARAA